MGAADTQNTKLPVNILYIHTAALLPVVQRPVPISIPPWVKVPPCNPLSSWGSALSHDPGIPVVGAAGRAMLRGKLQSSGSTAATQCSPFLPALLADDQTPSQAAGLRARGRAGREGACLLPEDRLGETGEQGDPTTVQAQSGECSQRPLL